MTIFTYRNNSPTNYVHKSLTEISHIDGVLRDNCDWLNPAFQIDYTDIQGASGIGNYAYIPGFLRYYYLVKIEHNYQNLYTVYFHVDALMSHWDKIKNSIGIASRSSTTMQRNLSDPMVATTNPPNYVYYDFSHDTTFSPGAISNDGFILTVANPAIET